MACAVILDPRQIAYAEHRKQWRADHPIGPFVAPDALQLAFTKPKPTVDVAAIEESERVSRFASTIERLKADGLRG